MLISNTLPTAVSQVVVVDGGVLHLRSALLMSVEPAGVAWASISLCMH